MMQFSMTPLSKIFMAAIVVTALSINSFAMAETKQTTATTVKEPTKLALAPAVQQNTDKAEAEMVPNSGVYHLLVQSFDNETNYHALAKALNH